MLGQTLGHPAVRRHVARVDEYVDSVAQPDPRVMYVQLLGVVMLFGTALVAGARYYTPGRPSGCTARGHADVPIPLFLLVCGAVGLTWQLVLLIVVCEQRAINERVLAGTGKQRPPVSACLAVPMACFCCVWMVLGTVWVFWFDFEQSFQIAPNATTADREVVEDCASAQRVGYVLMICFFTVPPVITCLATLVFPPLRKPSGDPAAAADGEECDGLVQLEVKDGETL